MHWNLSEGSKSYIIFSSYFYKQIQINRASTKCFIFLYTHTRTKWIAISSPVNTYGSKIKSNIQSLNKNTIRYTNRSRWDRFCTTIFSPTKPPFSKKITFLYNVSFLWDNAETREIKGCSKQRNYHGYFRRHMCLHCNYE